MNDLPEDEKALLSAAFERAVRELKARGMTDEDLARAAEHLSVCVETRDDINRPVLTPEDDQ